MKAMVRNECTCFYTLSHRECGQLHPRMHENFEKFEMISTPTGSWIRSRLGAIESNCPSGSKSSRIFQNFHAYVGDDVDARLPMLRPIGSLGRMSRVVGLGKDLSYTSTHRQYGHPRHLRYENFEKYDVISMSTGNCGCDRIQVPVDVEIMLNFYDERSVHTLSGIKYHVKCF